ncbi:unnamed protein product [Linum tenue]|nr:unnamed protein product [Linum tenue]
MLGSTLFVDKSRDRVRPVVNLFLDELEEIDQYSWRPVHLLGCTDALVRRLVLVLGGWLVVSHFCSVGSTSTFRVSGHLTLSHLSLDLMRLGLHDGFGQPATGSVADPSVRLAFYRRALDSLTPADVFWTPFHQRPHLEVRRSLYTGVIRFADIGEFL